MSWLGVGSLRLDEHVVGLDLAAQEALRERRAVVRGIGVGREDRHRARASGLAEGRGDARRGQTSAHDHDAVRHLALPSEIGVLIILRESVPDRAGS